jgi:hypothetical protein
MASQQDAATSAAWRTALKSLQIIPLAVAKRSLPKEDLHYLASQAEVDCTRAQLPGIANYSSGDKLSLEQLQLVMEQAQQPWLVSYLSARFSGLGP